MKRYYKVAEHNFSLDFTSPQPSEQTLAPYAPFEVDECKTLFDVEFVDTFNFELGEPVIVDADLSSEGMVRVDVYKTERGYQYIIFLPGSNEKNGEVDVDFQKSLSTVVLYGSPMAMRMALTNALILSYMNFTIEHTTMLYHSSTVIKDGRAYAFIGKSGTGKSTHSKMWLEAFSDAELLNDDHPIIRVHDDGTAMIYGSPWSGKTHCYRNLQAPLAAIVRIERAKENSARKLRPIQALGSISTSCSGMQWSEQLVDFKMKSLEKLIIATPCYIISCLPNVDAAHVCHDYINS